MKPDEQQATLSGSILFEWQLSERTTGSQHPLKQQSSDIKTRTYTAYLHNFLCDYFETTTADDTRCFLSYIFSIAQRLKLQNMNYD